MNDLQKLKEVFQSLIDYMDTKMGAKKKDEVEYFGEDEDECASLYMDYIRDEIDLKMDDDTWIDFSNLRSEIYQAAKQAMRDKEPVIRFTYSDFPDLQCELLVEWEYEDDNVYVSKISIRFI